MANHKETDLVDARFDLPDTLTVRQQLDISNKMAFGRNDNPMVMWWEIAKSLMTNWQSEIMPDPLVVDIDTETNREITAIILWCSSATVKWYNELGQLEKNM